MASIINAATSGGLVTTADTSGILQLQTAGTTAVTVDASQKVGIGTSSPSEKLDVLVAANKEIVSFTPTSSSGIADFSTGGVGWGFSRPNDGAARHSIYSYDTAAAAKHNLVIQARSDLIFTTDSDYTGATERMRLDSAGTLKTYSTISVGNATPSSSGAGITFPITQSVSSNSNTLDDYEEGTFTPAVTGSTTNPTVSYNWRYGYYTKIGNQVTLWFGYNVASISSAGSGNLRVTIPFTSSNRSDNRIPGTVSGGVSYTAGSVLIISNYENSAFIEFKQFNSTPSSSVLSVSSLNGSSESVQMCITITVD